MEIGRKKVGRGVIFKFAGQHLLPRQRGDRGFLRKSAGKLISRKRDQPSAALFGWAQLQS